MSEIRIVADRHYVDGFLVDPQPSPCHVLIEGAWVYSESAAKSFLNKERKKAVDNIESRSNASRSAVIQDSDKTLEYSLAEADAALFLQDGGAVPTAVSAWANFKKIEPATAATEIIVKAKRMKDALNELRVIRFTYRAQVESALTTNEIDVAYQEFLKAIFHYEKKYV